jgi:hypothetical protein
MVELRSSKKAEREKENICAVGFLLFILYSTWTLAYGMVPPQSGQVSLLS